jgi:hypothetical protein
MNNSTKQIAALAMATAPFFAAKFGYPKTALALGAAAIASEYMFANSGWNGEPSTPYTQNEWITAGIFAAGVGLAAWKPHWALLIGAGVWVVEFQHSGGFGRG